MIRACLRFLACWYLDSERDVPHWLQRRIDADPKLHESLEHLRRLERDLRFAARTEIERTRNDRVDLQAAMRSRDASPSRSHTRIGSFSLRGGQRAFPFAMAASLAILASASAWLITAASKSPRETVAIAPEDPHETNGVRGSNEEEPAKPEAATPSEKKPLPLTAAARWLDRSLRPAAKTASQVPPQESSNATGNPEFAAWRWESAWREQLASVKTGVRDGTRYFAVRLPAASIRMLRPGDR